MATIKTEPANYSGANPVKVRISAAGPPLPVALRVGGGGRATIENISGKTVLVEVKEDRQEEASETIQVYVYDLSLVKKSPVYRVNPSDPTFMLKNRISQRESIPLDELRLYMDGKYLNDRRSFADNNVENNDVISLSHR